MKQINQFITEYIIKKKLDKPIDSEDHYEYYPKTKQELIENINQLIKKNIYDFNCIDTSAITNMSHLFDMSLDILIRYSVKDVYFDVSEWNVSNVTDMSYMFYDCKRFNCNLSGWDVSSVTDMYSMFYDCKLFNQDLSDWNVSNVTYHVGICQK